MRFLGSAVETRRSGLATTSESAGTGPDSGAGTWLMMTIIPFALLCNDDRGICLIDIGTKGRTIGGMRM